MWLELARRRYHIEGTYDPATKVFTLSMWGAGEAPLTGNDTRLLIQAVDAVVPEGSRITGRRGLSVGAEVAGVQSTAEALKLTRLVANRADAKFIEAGIDLCADPDGSRLLVVEGAL